MKKYFKVQLDDGRSFIVTDKRPNPQFHFRGNVLIAFDKDGKVYKGWDDFLVFYKWGIVRELKEDEVMLEIL